MSGQNILITGGAGSCGLFLAGSFLKNGYKVVEKCLFSPVSFGRIFNMGTAYVTWDEVTGIVKEVTGCNSQIVSTPSSDWKGSAFLADPRALDDTLARQMVGYSPADSKKAKALFINAIAA